MSEEAEKELEVLLRQQEELRREGGRVLADLDLPRLLEPVGTPALTGSFALGLMVWRDIDLYVFCDDFSADRCFEAMRPLASHPRVKKLRWDNERGERNTGWLPNGYYFGVRYWTATREEWKVDVWFLPRTEEAERRERLDASRAALTPRDTRIYPEDQGCLAVDSGLPQHGGVRRGPAPWRTNGGRVPPVSGGAAGEAVGTSLSGARSKRERRRSQQAHTVLSFFSAGSPHAMVSAPYNPR